MFGHLFSNLRIGCIIHTVSFIYCSFFKMSKFAERDNLCLGNKKEKKKKMYDVQANDDYNYCLILNLEINHGSEYCNFEC